MPMHPETDCADDPAYGSASAASPSIPVSRRELLAAGDIAVRGLLDLSAVCGDESVFPLPGWLQETIAGAERDVRQEPDPGRARRAIGDRFGRSADEVLLTAGAADAYRLLATALRPRRAVVIHPQLTSAEAVLATAGVPVERVVLDESDGFRLDSGAMPDDADLVVVANPMNPAGVLSPADVLLSLGRPGRLVVVDECLADAVPGERHSLAAASAPADPTADDAAPVSGIAVLRGMPTAWPLAGVRAGYLLADRGVIEELATLQVRCPLSAPAISLLEAANGPTAVAAAASAAERLAADRAYLLDQLRQLPGIRVVGAPRSTVLVARVRDGRRLRARLTETGRTAELLPALPGLGVDHVRIPVRDHLSTARLVAALEATLR